MPGLRLGVVGAVDSSHAVPASPETNQLKLERVDGLGCIGHLVTRASFKFGKVEIVAINDSFIDQLHGLRVPV